MLVKSYDMSNNLTKEECFKLIVNFFAKNKITTPRYMEAIIEREKQASFYIGNFVSIPHGSLNFKNEIKSSGILILRFKKAIKWDNDWVHYVIGIASIGEEQIEILQEIAIAFCSEEKVISSLNQDLKNLSEQFEWK